MMDSVKNNKIPKIPKNPPKGGTKVQKDVKVKEFSSLEGRFLLVKVGNDAHPAIEEDIKDIRTRLISLFEENGVKCLTFVTHHAVDVMVI